VSAALAASRGAKVVVADDHPAMLKTVTGILATRFDVIAAVSDGKAALDAAAQTHPDVVLLDIMMPGIDGIRTAKELKRTQSRTRIVFLTGQEDDDFVFAALEVGARGYVFKRRLQSDIVPALNLALAGECFISPDAFRGSPKHATDHLLQFYTDETIFFDQASEMTYHALAKREQVFLFLSKMGLRSVRERLRSGGLDYAEAIRSGHLQAFSVENVLPALMTDDFVSLDAIRRGQFTGEEPMPFLFDEPWPDPGRFESFFCPYLKRAVTRSQERGSKVTIISDTMATLLRDGYGHNVAFRIDKVWNDLIPTCSSIVYCGCPTMHLSLKRNRETLVRICAEHSRVVFIDPAKQHAHQRAIQDSAGVVNPLT
jgi:DNA-binding NarL/FixJ family response regulator